ncbi:MAG: ComEC/Rec2 family competence protein [Micavibrio sp.]
MIGLAREFSAQRERLFIWSPVPFGAGIAFYFALAFEPASFWPPVLAGILAVLAALFYRRRQYEGTRYYAAYILSAALALALCGFCAAIAGTKIHGTPILPKAIGPVMVEGVVEGIENLGPKRGSRVVLGEVAIEGLEPAQTPRKVRLGFKKDEGLRAGLRIKALVRLDAPSRAVAPGAYDFRRHLFFHGIGAVGFAYSAAEAVAEEQKRYFVFENIRTAINEAIRKESGLISSGIMTALITGERGAIAEEDNEAMRDSGLYHLLSISGAHVTMVAGILFFAFRAAMAAVPFIALRYPIKKIAAFIALAGAAFYVTLAGAEVPAQRALLMTGFIMIAIMLDRTPISLRLIAFAALIVLLIAPHALVGVSFQMSFSAVAALICFFEYIAPWWHKYYARMNFAGKSVMYLVGILLTSVIAGTMTGLFTLYHFQTFPVYGVLANMLAVPLTGAVIMPAAVGIVFLMPLGIGLESFPAAIMEWGVVWMLAIAHWTAGLDGAVIDVQQWPVFTFLCIVAGTILLILWKGWRGKGLAVLILMAGIICALAAPRADIYISGTGKLNAVREGDFLYLSSLRREKFTAGNWMRLTGQRNKKPFHYRDRGTPVLCDMAGCRAEIPRKEDMGITAKIAMPANPRAFAEDCHWADVIIADWPLNKKHCDSGAVLIDLFDARRNGAHAVYFTASPIVPLFGGRSDIKVRSVGAEGGKRPWTP